MGTSGPSTVMAVALSRSPLLMWIEKAERSREMALTSAALLVSMKRRFTRPREHPTNTPTICPKRPIRCTRGVALWAGLSFGRGRPSRAKAASICAPPATPATSEQICPQAAAANVDRPNVTPRVRSMKLPAWIMTVLSTRPKPTIGTAETKNHRRSSSAGMWDSSDNLELGSPEQPPLFTIILCCRSDADGRPSATRRDATPELLSGSGHRARLESRRPHDIGLLNVDDA
eukprot:scaffold2187_cov109-Isochrysis_galbana.AAC.2